MKWFSRRAHLFFSQRIWQAAILFILAVILFSFLQWTPTFADPDSFYHVKMAQELVARGTQTSFPWLSATTLKYEFTDHQLLYHLLMIPFVTLLPPLIGIKVATVLLASLAIVGLFLLLSDLKVRGAFWFALFSLTINPFVFRITLAKAQPLVILFLFIFLYLLFHRRFLWLVFISFLYVWLYAGWPIVIALAIFYGGIQWVWAVAQHGWPAVAGKKIKVIWQNALLLASVATGVVAGIFFNPYFPLNLKFYWQQSFQIAIVNYQSRIGVGAEWYPYQISSLFADAMPFCILVIIALILFIVTLKKQSMTSWFFAIVAAIFFLLTLKSRRYVEYLIPLAIYFSALSITGAWPLLEQLGLRRLPAVGRRWIIPVLFLAISPIFYHDLSGIREFYRTGFPFDRFSAPMAWLQQHSSPGDIVFHSDWDQFPILFYYNDYNYYLVGLDPTFMYQYSPSLYQRWVDITLGRPVDDLPGSIEKLFGAKYVFVDYHKNAALDKNLASNFFFQKVFENNEAKIYRLTD